MVTILIVEDELEAREGIKKYIPWQQLGIDVVEEAENGLDAISLCEGINPDILLTDVRMPKMDGIQLATYVRERFPNCKIIFLSGFSDKIYLKSAIRLGAINYIEKPVDIEELNSLLSEAVYLLAKVNKRREEELLLQSIVTENLHLILQKLALDAVYKAYYPETIENTHPVLKNIFNCNSEVCSVIVKLHEAASLTEEEKEFYRLEMLTFMHKDIVLKSEFNFLIPGFLDNDKLLIHCINSNNNLDSFDTKILTLISKLKIHYEGKFIFSAVIGQKVPSFYEAAVSSQSALKSLSKLFFMHKGQELFCKPASRPVYMFAESDLEAFQQLIEGNTLNAVADFLDKLVSEISTYPDTDTGYVKNIYFKLFMMLFELAARRNIKSIMLESEGIYIWQEISKMETIFDITSYLLAIVGEYFKYIGNKNEIGQPITDIFNYIDGHFCEQNLSIKSIAEYVHYDHFYMCTLFKKHTGKTLNDYITQLRIEKAKELLKDKNVRLYDITGMVGYVDPSYFSKIFKKIAGCSPSEFRGKYFL